jgi:LuxR family transcriptional regulator, maltose regulon positive regulatory protein
MTTSAVRLAVPPKLCRPEADDDLLIAKITPPPLPGWLVPRHRIGALISAGARGPLTVITGPPGAGKTMAIASWVAGQHAPGPVAWLSVDGYDNRPGGFWPYVAESIRRAGVPVPPPSLADAPGDTAGHVFLLRLASALAARSSPVVLVLDDVHLLTHRRHLAELSYLLTNAGGALRVVLASRTEPPLPMHRLRLTGELTEIPASELAFNVPEAGLLMTQHGIRLSGPALARLTERTEGWAAGLRLAAVSMRGHRDPDQRAGEFSLQDSGVLSYLQDEVLLPRSVRDLDMLLKTCFLDRVCDDLAGELTGDRRAGARLATLAAANAFIQPLGHGWYRYHPLFAEVLSVKLRQQCGSGDVRELHRRAARWFRRSGELGDAVSQAAAAGDWELATRAVVEEQAIEALMDPRLAGPLADGLHGMPLSYAQGGPPCLLVSAVLAVRDHRADTGGVLLRAVDRALDQLPAGQEIPSRLAAAQIRLYLARRAGDLHRAEEAAAEEETLLAALPDEWVAQHPKARASTLADRGVVELWRGRFDAAATALQAGAWCDAATGADRAGHRALVEAVRGRLDRAAELAAAELSPMDGQSGVAAPTAAAEVALAWAHLDRGRLDQSRNHLARVQDALRAAPDKLVAALAYLVAARHSLATGHPDPAVQMIDRARTGWSPPPWLAHRLMLAESRARAAVVQARASGGDAQRVPAAPAPSAHQSPVIVGQLSQREREVLRRAATLLSTAEIAEELYLSANTVKSHLRSSYRKLGASRRGEAIRRAQQLQLL